MSVQTRATALQNEVVRLYCYFIKDGMLANPSGQPSVEILDTDGATVLDVVNPGIENTGVWYADWFVPANLPLANYYDRWTYQWDANSGVQEMTMIFTVHSLDSYINFISRGITIKTSNRANQLLHDLANDFIYEAMHIPVYFEQAQRMMQENQAKRTKTYYYFVLDGNDYSATESAVYTIGGKNFTIFQDLVAEDPSSESSSSSIDSSSSSSSSSIDSSSSSSSSSMDSSSSKSSESSESSSSSSIDSSSSASDEFTTTTTTPYTPQSIMTCVGSSDPPSSGTLTKVSGEGDTTITFTSFTKRTAKLSTMYNFAYRHWNQDPQPIVRVNNRITDDGWHLDYDGKIYFDSLMAPEDSVNVAYNFAYFGKEELLSFLNFGLQMMNGLPPASTSYRVLESAPQEWNPGILLYAAILALKRLIFGLSWQEKRIIFGRPEDAQHAQQTFQDLYKSYTETWTEFGKNVKTLKLPGIAMYVTPEYTLPGGRSRWFRYLYKSSSG